MIISRRSSGSSCFNSVRQAYDSTLVKVNALVTFLLFTATLTVGCLQVNAMVTYALLGLSVAALLTTGILARYCRREGVGDPFLQMENSALPPLIFESSEEESSETRRPLLLTPVDRPLQLDKFKQLLGGSEEGRAHASSHQRGTFNILCDQYKTGFPSYSARICLEDKTETNGALVWEKLILIQGPHNDDQIEHMWRIAAEKRAGAIIRLGQIEGYKAYCPGSIPRCFDELKIESELERPRTLFHSTTCIHYTLEFRRERRSFPVYVVQGWRDFKTNSLQEIVDLCHELDKIEGPLIIHCRGGFGRTGTFAVCWKIFQLFKAARERRERPIEIDPAALVEEMRLSRTGTVQTEDQFLMILDFIDLLNGL